MVSRSGFKRDLHKKYYMFLNQTKVNKYKPKSAYSNIGFP